MATSFRGWGGAWGDSWGTVSVITTNRLKYWNGSSWVAKTLKYWNGSSWQTKTLKCWNGTTWI